MKLNVEYPPTTNGTEAVLPQTNSKRKNATKNALNSFSVDVRANVLSAGDNM